MEADVNITSVVFPKTVKAICDMAFFGCYGLTSITIPDSVTSIGDSALANCTNLTNINVDEANTVYHSNGNCLIEILSKTLISGCQSSIIPADGSVTRIGESAFEWCDRLTSVTIPNSVTSIGSYTFASCDSLMSVTIPDSVASIGERVFYYCSALTDITINSKDVVIYDSSYTIPSNATIRGYEGSTAQAYATKYNRTFEVIKDLSGDMDGNDGVNTNDAIYLLRYTFEPDKYPLSKNGDINDDGEVDSADAIYLLRHVLLPEKYPLN